VETYAATFGPLVKAREALAADGRWPALRRDLSALFKRHDRSPDENLAIHGEYLTVAGRKLPHRRANGRRHALDRDQGL
jgi:hypothetical protein